MKQRKHILGIGLIIGSLALGSMHSAMKFTINDGLISPDRSIAIEEQGATQGDGDWVTLQKALRNGIVQVFSYVAELDLCEPHKSPSQMQKFGSGFFISEDFIGGEGYIVSNYHVVDKVSFLQIQIPGCGKDRFDVEIAGVSPQRDLALLRVKQPDLERIKEQLGSVPFLELGDSDAVDNGQKISALGYPLGQQNLKITQGCVSGRERVQMGKYVSLWQSFIQIDAAINPGNSGGCSINRNGEVIGINSAASLGAQNVGWIIPINDVKGVLKDLRDTTFLARPFLGAEFSPTSEDTVKYLGNPDDGGFYVHKIYEGSILEKQGIKSGDALYKFTINNGQTYNIDRYGELDVPWSEGKVALLDISNRLGFGDDITAVFYRNGQPKEISFKLEEEEFLPIRQIFQGYDDIDYEILGGMEITPFSLNHLEVFYDRNPFLVKYCNRDNQYDGRLILTHIFPNSQTQRARCFEEGMIIDSINGQEVRNLDQFREAVKKSADTGYITVTTDNNRFMVLSLDKVLDEEDWLSNAYIYQKSNLVNELTRLRTIRKAAQ